MATEGILRLITVRPAKLRASASALEIPVSGPLLTELESTASDTSRQELRAIAGRHRAANQAERATTQFDPGPLLDWVERNVDAPSAEAGLPEAVRESYGRDLAELTADAGFAEALAKAGDSIVAAVLLGSEPGTSMDEVVRTFKVLSLVRDHQARTGNDTFRTLIGDSVVTLPEVLVRADEPTPPAQPVEPADPTQEDRDRIAALAEAHREFAGLVTDPRHHVSANASRSNDSATATDEFVGTGTTNAGELLVAPTAWDGLSAAARAVTAPLNLAGAAFNPLRVVSWLEGELHAAVSKIAARTVPNTVIQFNGGELDLGEFRKAEPVGGARALLAAAVAATHSQAGIADLLVVRQKIKAYELGEFAHVENVMGGETRQRDHRRLTQVEEIVETETETETEKEKDLQSTERDELQNEAEKTVRTDLQIDAGLQVSGSYGPAVSFTASLNASHGTTTEEAQRKASSFSQELTQRTVEKVRERVRTLARRRTLEEFEEKNLHKFENSMPSRHIRGVYRWLNKIYDAQVFHYGQRMMFDFVVPEPAAYFLYALVENPPKDSELVKPQLPTFGTAPLSPANLTAENYANYVARYRVADVPPPPAAFRSVTFFDKQDGKEFSDLGRSGKVTIPEGYQAVGAWVQGDYTFQKDKDHHFRIMVGGRIFDLSDTTGTRYETFAEPKQNEITVAAHLFNSNSFAIGVDVLCELTPAGTAKWQQQAYDAIIRAYQSQLTDYQERKIAESLQTNSKAFGHNPLVNRRIEREELKKWVVMMLTKSPSMNLNSFTGAGEPVLDQQAAYDNGRFIRFFENAFEWNNMLYVCYPHFWGRRSRWAAALNLTDPDPDFAAFLRAGAARVQVPVRPGFEAAVAYYGKTGQIWEGNDVPVDPNDTVYVPIVKEITENLGKIEGGVPYPAGSKPWQVTVPTDLVLVQDVDDVPAMRDVLTGNPAGLDEE